IRYQDEEKIPTLYQLQQWIILLIKWPDMARWLQFDSAALYYTNNDGQIVEQNKKGNMRINSAGFKLYKLEELALKCVNDDIQLWKTEIGKDVDLHIDINKT